MKKPALKIQLTKASRYLGKLFSLRFIKIILVFLFVIVIAPIIVFLFLKPQTQHNINYGVTFSNKYATQMGLDWKYTYIQILDDLKARNLRLVAYWDDVERNKDTYDFSEIKWQLEEAQKRDANVIMTIGRKVPRYPECFEPEWWREEESETVREYQLMEYLKTAVNELKGYDTIKYWQVENEPFWSFGVCMKIDKETVKKEIALVRSLDDRPILVQDSGEGGLWKDTYELGDYLGISMYRKIWYDFWGLFLGNFIYFQYPLAHWSYKIKADLVGVPYEKIFVTELQAEPWGPGLNSTLPEEEKIKTMSRTDFLSTITYAQKAGFKNLYLWGAEWWLFEKEVENNPFYWETAKALFN